MEFNLEKFDSLTTKKKKSKYDFLNENKELAKKLIETIKRGVAITTITEELNKQLNKGENYINTISLKDNLKTIIENDNNLKEEYKDLFKARKTRKKKEVK